MTGELNLRNLREIRQAIENKNPALGEGGTIVIPEPIWSESSREEQDALVELAKAHGFGYRIERRWQVRPPEGHGITKVSVEKGSRE